MRVYYEILGVGERASDQEIRRAFRRLALKYHPDVNGDTEAEERFKEIYEAYQALLEVVKPSRQKAERELTCDICMGTGELSLCGPKYLAARLCDALGVLEPARNQLPRGGCITLLSTVSARTATVAGPNGRDGVDRVVLVRVES